MKKAAWGLVVLAADLFQFGGLLSVGADTCVSPGISCSSGFGPKNPLPTTNCAGVPCINSECCDAGEKEGSSSSGVRCRLRVAGTCPLFFVVGFEEGGGGYHGELCAM